MHEPKDSDPSCSAIIAPPYTDLHIYYFKGHLTLNEAVLGKHFIGNWQEDEFSFLFFSSPETAIVDRVLKLQPQLTFLDKFTIPYADWLGEKPVPIEIDRFYIAAPWQKVNPPEGKLPIVLDPGIVFGTGTHPTTADCLTALNVAFGEHRFETVLDIGTGTGLLAIAAAILGGMKILAADLNYLAARTAYQNVQLNHLEDKIMVIQASAENIPFRGADLVVANIHFDAMRYLINSSFLAIKTHFILSGLLRSQINPVLEMLTTRHACILRQWHQNHTWHTLYGVTG